MTNRSLAPLSALLLAALAGCGGGSVDSGTMTITVNSMNESDIRTPGVVQKDENISNDSGNPWGEFVKRARDQCGGDPAGFEVLGASVGLDTSGGGNVQRFEDVSGAGDAVTAFFASTSGSDATAVKADVGSVTGPTGAGPIPLALSATRASLAPLHGRLVGGDFHVGVRVGTYLTAQDRFTMDVRVSFSVRAHCD